MKRNIRSNRNSGFTMVEMLAAVAILVILLGVSAVAAVHYVDYLKITELDNAARSIYMAAENRAGLLSNGRRLERLVNTGSQQAGSCYAASTDASMQELLPDGCIDPALWQGGFYIVYDPESGSVTDVFYAEEDIASLGDFADVYSMRDASRDQRMRQTPMLGYYGGGGAEGGNIDRLHTPGVTVLIKNGEQLIVEVNFEIPDNVNTALVQVSKSVKVQYQGKEIELLKPEYSGRLVKPVSLTNGTSFAWILDGLENDNQFFRLFGNNEKVSFGEEVTVTATVELSMPGTRSSSAEASDTNHPLFDKSSNGETARIKYLRHLQNLDCEFSNSAGTGALKAVQTANITCEGEFKPIKNEYLVAYDGREREIRDLNVDCAGNAGLFAGASDTAFQNIRLVNATVKTSGDYAGALLGYGENVTFGNCWVYWEPGDQQTLMDLLVLDRSGEEYVYNYRISGKNAGGLAGGLTGNSNEIQKSLSATLISGTASAGGLVGECSGGLTIQRSYADCYLQAPKAAGLAGTVNSITVENCYSAGFVDMRHNTEYTAAGLCLGSANTKNVYSAMRYINVSEKPGTQIYPLWVGSGSPENTYYLNLHLFAGDTSGAVPLDYDEMTRPREDGAEGTGSDFSKQMEKEFLWKSAQSSHPYNIRRNLKLNTYEFPGLLNLPHYGDWTAEFKEPSLVYYEEYKDDTCGFSGGNARYLVGKLEDNKSVIMDGYAVAMRQSDLEIGSAADWTLTIQYEFSAIEGGTLTDEVQESDILTATWEKKDYYLIPLPEEFNHQESSVDFYQYLKFSFEAKDGPATGDYFFNPHFADTVEPVRAQDRPAEGWTAEAIAKRAGELLAKNYNAVSIRTPRHLYELSERSEYFRNTKYLLSFQQDLDLNYSAYTDYQKGKLSNNFTQTPIGSTSAKFRGTYNGGGHTIRGVGLGTAKDGDCAGLFGCSEGSLYNIVYQLDMEEDDKVLIKGMNGESLYLGGLVGWNDGGRIENCSVRGLRLEVKSYYARVYLGGLVGQNNGIIRASAAESPELKGTAFSYGSVYMGGLIGWNNRNGAIDASYGVGYLSGEADQTARIWVCGFVGMNEGRISNSYTAARLRHSGEGASAHGFCGQGSAGSLSGAYYLNLGNFTYWDAPYAANYEDTTPGAKGLTYAELTAENSPLAGMGRAEGDYPYPTAVRSGTKYVYPGQEWPKTMSLGQMGVYYWEKLRSGTKVSYNVSMLSVDTDTKIIAKQQALSVDHANGSVVEEYGYGYYTLKNLALNGLDTANIYYAEQGGAKKPLTLKSTGLEAEEVNKQLEKDFAELFTFHSYRSFDRETQVGLYPVVEQGRPNGTITLTENSGESVKLEVTLNPFFADAMSVKVPDGWTPKNGVPVTGKDGQDPGLSQNPYEVRTINQLQFINWNAEKYNTTTVMTVDNYGQFPYLSSGKHSADYYWQQTHDIIGGKNADGSYKTYTPIAEYYDTTKDNQGNLNGWFGGVYNGDDYVIENVNIQGQQSSCAGLFGVVYNGKLSNIVLYSSDGQGTISSYADDATESCWYAIGGLAGMAASSKDSAVENCSVAGYKIMADVHMFMGSGLNWGGAEIGGLVGISNMDLKNCAAVTTITLPGSIKSKDNIRMGGLVGASQKSIQNCYAGGEIIVNELNSQNNNLVGAGIYVGGIVGGSYFKPLQPTGGSLIGVVGSDKENVKPYNNTTNNEIYDSYSYVTLPKMNADGYNKIGKIYAIGGTGEIKTAEEAAIEWDVKVNHGTCTIKNCYVLGEVLTEEQNTYKDVAGYTLGGSTTDAPKPTYKVGDTLGRWDEKPTETIQVNNGTYYYFKSDGEKTGTALFSKTGNNKNPTYTCGGYLIVENGKYRLTTDWNEVTKILNPPKPGTYCKVEVLTYEQLANQEPIPAKDNKMILEWLNAFRPVTSGSDDKYSSYPPGDRPELQGLDYPFPTILTRENELFKVHYGQWPLSGISREDGGKPIELDLFVEAERSKTEKLTLTASVKDQINGAWTVEGYDEELVDVKVDKGELTVTATGEKTGITIVTVKYKEPDGSEFSRKITVSVGADLRMVPSMVTLFTGGTVKILPQPSDRHGNLLEKGELKLRDITGSESVNAESDQDSIEDDGSFTVFILTGAETPSNGAELIRAEYVYTQDGKTYEGISSILVEVKPLPEPEFLEDKSAVITFEEDVESVDVKVLTGEADATVADKVITLTRKADAPEEALEVKLQVTATMDEREHTFIMTVEMPWEEEAPENPDPENPEPEQPDPENP